MWMKKVGEDKKHEEHLMEREAKKSIEKWIQRTKCYLLTCCNFPWDWIRTCISARSQGDSCAHLLWISPSSRHQAFSERILLESYSHCFTPNWGSKSTNLLVCFIRSHGCRQWQNVWIEFTQDYWLLMAIKIIK